MSLTLALSLSMILAPAHVQDEALSSAELRTRLRAPLPTFTHAKTLQRAAWAAYEIASKRRSGLEVDLNRLLAKLATFRPRSREIQFLARSCLDALVCTGARAPAKTLLAWRRKFPNLTLVLAGREPAVHTKLLFDRIQNERSDIRWQAACNLLVRGAPTVATPELLRRVRIELRIRVHEPGRLFGIGGRSGFRSHDGRMTRPDGFPPTAVYRLVHSESSKSFAPGPEAVHLERRVRTRRTFGVGANGVHVDRDDYVLRCLLQLARQRDTKRTLLARVRRNVEWQDADTYVTSVLKARRAVETDYRKLVARLTERKLLQEPAPRLQLAVRVSDRRDDRLIALPQIPGVVVR